MKIEKIAQNKEEAKADNGKPKLSLVPRQIIFDIAKVREFGTKKYGDSENWRQVEVQRYRDAAFRHFMAYLDDPYGVDEESRLSHLSHLACNIAFLCEMEHVDEIVTEHNKEALRKAEADIQNAKRYIGEDDIERITFVDKEMTIMKETEKTTYDIIADAVRKYWKEESQHPESVVVYFYQKYDFDGDDKWALHAEYVRPFNSDDFYNMIFDHDFCEGQGDVKDINIASAEKVFDFYYYAWFHWKGL